jgi:hypothetical protein
MIDQPTIPIEKQFEQAAKQAREAAEKVLRDARVDPDDKRRPMTI